MLFRFLLFIALVFTYMLSANEKIKVSYDPDYAPFSYAIEDKPFGLLIDIWKEWGKVNNKKIEFVNGHTWEEAVDLVKTKKVDYFLGTDPYEKWMYNSLAFYKTSTSMFTLKNSTSKFKTIGIIGDDYKEELSNKFPNVKIKSFDTYKLLVDALKTKNVDSIYDDTLALNDYITQKRLNHFIVSNNRYSISSEICAISYNKEKINIFNNGFQKIDSLKLYNIEKQWVLNTANQFYNKQENTLQLSYIEQEWIKQHPVITVHNEKNWAPVNFNKHGTPAGLSIDYMNLLAKKIGIKVKYVTGEWNDLYHQALNKKVDVMLNIAKSKEREKFFLFTEPYQKNSISIFGRSDDKTIVSLDSLNGKKVTIVDGFYHESMLRKEFPRIQIIPVKNAEEAIQKVCEKKADATIGSFIVKSHIIAESLCQNLEYKIPFEVEKSVDLHIAVRDDYLELHSILQKAMASIGSNEMNKIRQKWIIQGTNNKNFTLNEEEKKWLNQYSKVIVGVEKASPPFSFMDENNEYQGLASDYLNLIAEVSGLNFEIKPDTWSNILSDLKQKQIHLTPTMFYTKERTAFTHFTNTYLKLSQYYITRKDYKTINSIKELDGIKIATIKGSSISSWIKKEHPQIKLHEVDTNLDGLNAVKMKAVDVFIQNNPSSSYAIKNNFLTGLKFNNILEEKPPGQVKIGVNIDSKPLMSIINKALKAIPPHKIKEVNNKWMNSVKAQNTSLQFSENEINWIKTKPTIQFAVDPNWLPIEAIDSETGAYKGIMADYLAKIAQRTGLKFQLVATENWTQSVELIKNNQINMLAAASITPQREKHLNFSKTTLTLNDGVIMRSDAKFISDLKELKGLKVGISTGTALHRFITITYPDINIIPIKGTEKGIDLLNNEEIDAYIGNLEVISYLIFKKNLLNIKVVLKLDTARELHIALHKNYPSEALSIINKAIDSITPEEKSLIRQKWIGLQINNSTDYMLLLKISLGVLLLISFFIYSNRKLQKMVKIRTKEISEQKDELENLSKNLEKIVDKRTQQLHDERNYINSIMNSQENILVSTDGEIIHTANRSFFMFFGVQSLEEFFETYGHCICNTFDEDDKSFIQKIMGDQTWVNYIYNNNEKLNKVKITLHGETHIFSVTADQFFHDNKLLDVAVFTNITELENTQKQLQIIHKHTRDSIEYASLIQHALIPDHTLFDRYFEDYFTIWKPKDIVGGDIYLFEHLRNDDECILMMIDCTGHGVPGAFVTMLVKAIERQLVSKIINNDELEVSTAWILSYFNRSMKKLLKQEDNASVANAGFDGGILYYNKLHGTIKYSGAETPLFYFDENNELQMIKGDRHSIGYKKSNIDYQFKEHIIPVKKGMKFYLTTDGYLDQNGGEKGFPFGKKRFKAILEEHNQESFKEQKEILLDSIQKYQNSYETNDDISVIGLKL